MSEDLKQLLAEIKKLTESDYCYTEEALLIIGLKDYHDLKRLSDLGVLMRYKRKGSSYVYKKTECKRVAELLDLQKIVI